MPLDSTFKLFIFFCKPWVVLSFSVSRTGSSNRFFVSMAKNPFSMSRPWKLLPYSVSRTGKWILIYEWEWQEILAFLCEKERKFQPFSMNREGLLSVSRARINLSRWVDQDFSLWVGQDLSLWVGQDLSLWVGQDLSLWVGHDISLWVQYCWRAGNYSIIFLCG